MRAVKGTHRFSFFAREVDILITCGGLGVQRTRSDWQLSNKLVLPRCLRTTGFKGLSWIFTSFSKLPVQKSTMRSDGRYRRHSLRASFDQYLRRDGSGSGSTLRGSASPSIFFGSIGVSVAPFGLCRTSRCGAMTSLYANCLSRTTQKCSSFRLPVSTSSVVLFARSPAKHNLSVRFARFRRDLPSEARAGRRARSSGYTAHCSVDSRSTAMSEALWLRLRYCARQVSKRCVFCSDPCFVRFRSYSSAWEATKRVSVERPWSLVDTLASLRALAVGRGARVDAHSPCAVPDDEIGIRMPVYATIA